MFNLTIQVKYPGDMFILSREPVEIYDYIRAQLKPHGIFPVIDEQDLAREILQTWLRRRDDMWNDTKQVVH